MLDDVEVREFKDLESLHTECMPVFSTEYLPNRRGRHT